MMVHSEPRSTHIFIAIINVDVGFRSRMISEGGEHPLTNGHKDLTAGCSGSQPIHLFMMVEVDHNFLAIKTGTNINETIQSNAISWRIVEKLFPRHSTYLWVDNKINAHDDPHCISCDLSLIHI